MRLPRRRGASGGRPAHAEGNGHPPSRRRALPSVLALVAAVALVGVAVQVAAGRSSGPQTLEERVQAIGSQLGCVTCQNLSVADSPAGTARAMRAEIKRRLVHGETADEIKAFFVAKYGQSILLSPRSVFPWVVPALALLAGVVLLAWAVGRRRPASEADPIRLTPADRARIRRELAALEEPD